MVIRCTEFRLPHVSTSIGRAADDEFKRAVNERLAEEIAQEADPDIEVVLLEADSRGTLLDTQARHFTTVAEIARSF